ncbi:Imm7 family immunity protein [Paenibacillus sp. V4I3]
MYIRDATDKQSHNCFKVYVLARGKVTEKEDMYLSPCNPTIED